MKVTIVAEIASNWEGNVTKAKKLIKECKKAGADAVKFQAWRAIDLYDEKHPNWKEIKKSELTFENIKLLNPRSGFYEQYPESWFIATIKCFNKIRRDKPKEFSAVRGLGISGQMHGATLIDKNNQVLHPCILWNDTRSTKQCLSMEEKYPSLREESGNIAMPGFTAPKILWIKENEIEIFDDFQHENSRNLGIRIVTRSYEKTYDDNETRQILMKISDSLEAKFKITLNSGNND